MRAKRLMKESKSDRQCENEGKKVIKLNVGVAV